VLFEGKGTYMDALGGEVASREAGTLSLIQELPLILPYCLVAIGLFSLAPALPLIQEVFSGAPNAEMLIGMVGAVGGFAFAASSLVMGRLVDHFGYRSVYIGALIVFTLAGLAGAVAPNLPILIMTRAIVGIAVAGAVNAALVGISQLVPPARRSRLLGLTSLAAGISSIAAAPTVGLLARIDWRAAFLPHILGLLIVPLAMLLPAARAMNPAAAAQSAKGHGVGGMLIAATVAVGMVIFVVNIYPPLYLHENGVTDPMLLSVPIMASSIGSIIGASFYSATTRRFGFAGTFGVLIGAMGVGLTICGLSSALVPLAIGGAMASFAIAMYSSHLNAAAIASCPDNPSRALGIVNATLLGSMMLFPFVAPIIIQEVGSRGIFFVFAGIAALFAVATPLAVTRHAKAAGARA
jgi:MFS family permease